MKLGGKVLGLSSIWNIARGSGNKEVETRRRDRRKVSHLTGFSLKFT